MIRINLAPPTEVKDKLWFIPELAIAIFVFALSWVGVQYFLNSIEAQTAVIKGETAEITKNIVKLHPDVEKFEQMTKQVEILKDKIRAVQRITVSKVARYLPVILLEHLQTLKPEGVWFNSVVQDATNNEINVSGGAFDSILISEFMGALDATKKIQPSITDIKSFIYFPLVNLWQVNVSGFNSTGPAAKGADKNSDAAKALAKKDKNKKIVSSGVPLIANSMFPELVKFPAFSVTIKYAEHGEDQKSIPVSEKAK